MCIPKGQWPGGKHTYGLYNFTGSPSAGTKVTIPTNVSARIGRGGSPLNEKIARRIEEMKKQTIGVEVEMNSITRQHAAEVAAEFFGTGRCENTAGRNGYCAWSAWDAQGREWKFQRDASIAGPDSEKCEMVTPILTYDDMETHQELCRRLRHAGAKSDAGRGCGVHIHIGANGHTAQTLRNLANIMGRHL